ncbi:hypothetical protein BVG19_g3855 [[Candida] boidinii]|nr:hypothetical protein BVG19_g3855 [[Candida] boidinii]OWB50349.1 oxidoreductase activity protein [[Candida] boidinii]
MKVVIVGAGLGGLSAAISVLMAGHEVLLLEGAHEISEVGAGLQILPNASRILRSYGLEKQLSKHYSTPRIVKMNRWKGGNLTSFDFVKQGEKMGSPFWDFHRADLQSCMLDRCKELGAEILCNSRVIGIQYDYVNMIATVTTSEGVKHSGDLIIGADGVNSKLRDLLVGHPDPPTPTGDLAYRVLLPGEKVLNDPELSKLITNPQVNYWLGPECHCVNYPVKKGKFFNFVLLCPDTVPEGMSICPGTVEEMKNIFVGWDKRLLKLMDLFEGTMIDKWKLCYREGIDHWYHESGMLALLGDSVHATLPYLASGAGMAIEDGAVIGKLLERFPDKSQLKKALSIYESKRKLRTERIVQRGNQQQILYHLQDGPEQQERDRILSMGEDAPAGEPLVWRDREMAPWLLSYDAFADAAAEIQSKI